MEFLVSQGKDPEEIDFDKEMEPMESGNGNDGTTEQQSIDNASNEQAAGESDKTEQAEQQEETTTEQAAEENKQAAGEEVEQETSKLDEQVDNAEKVINGKKLVVL